MSLDRIETGRSGEAHAAAHYRRQGYELIASNARTRFGELDLVLRSRETLVFCEVRTRVEGRGNPIESFDRRKALQVRRMATRWLSENRVSPRPSSIRLDAAAVTVSPDGSLVSLEVLEGAL
jgi:putative endonuclease